MPQRYFRCPLKTASVRGPPTAKKCYHGAYHLSVGNIAWAFPDSDGFGRIRSRVGFDWIRVVSQQPLRVYMGILTLQKWIPDSVEGRIPAEFWKLEMESANPGKQLMQGPGRRWNTRGSWMLYPRCRGGGEWMESARAPCARNTWSC